MKTSVHLLALLLFGGGGGASLQQASAQTASTNSATHAACTGLAGLKVAASRIGLPTRGAEILSAEAIPERVDGPNAHGAHCKVSGVIHPHDPEGFGIQLEIRLPVQWNGKALMVGGGGFEGTIPKLDEQQYTSLPTAPLPLARGYVVFGTDGGHKEDKEAPGKFLLNQEAYLNWMGDAIKKTRDVAMVVTKTAYGARPRKSYFIGGSSGGREGLIAAGRWPQDWDGVVSLYPARNQMVEIVGGLGINRAFAAPGAYPNRAQRAVLFKAGLQACDAIDGAADGIISAVKQCNARFNPATALVDGTTLRCEGGGDAGDTCLSDKQLDALAVMQRTQPFAITLANGESSFPGYNVYTSDTGMAKSHPLQQIIAFLALGLEPPSFPATAGMSLMAAFGDNFVRYGIARDTSVNPLTLGPENLGRYEQRIIEMSRLDLPERNLTDFAARGGKLLIMHGTADMIVSPRNSEAYYETLQSTMGRDEVATFLRYYEVPGFAHAVSTDFGAAWDYLTALENWAERGKDPGNGEIVMDLTGVPGRTRPLCQYPLWPKYAGSGDPDRASSYSCAAD